MVNGSARYFVAVSLFGGSSASPARENAKNPTFLPILGYLRTHWEQYLANFPEIGKSSATLIWPELNAQGILYEEGVTYVRTAAGITITGEASANTFFDVPPEIVKEFLPEIKLIVLFREIRWIEPIPITGC
ncbi:MAG: hypothetical protein R2806_23680 [Saprospiraceae bacterium]